MASARVGPAGDGGSGTAPAAGSTYRQILAVAEDYFANRGYDGTSIRDIAARVQIKPATLYSHFSSKEEILWMLVSSTIEDLHRCQDADADPDASPTAALHAFVYNHVLFQATRRDNALLASRKSSALASDRFAEFRRLRKLYEHRLEVVLERGVGSGDFAVQNTKIASFAILQMGTGVSAWFHGDGELDASAVATMYADFALRMVGAARPELSAQPEAKVGSQPTAPSKQPVGP